ncbi:MAG TPA: putative molybdenum carrier protein [Syntrophorhabdaceae bacterium]|jgi:hypothetical protein
MKIISGGQTGVDRAALDAAMDSGIECGGSIPEGRKAEDGPIDAKYTELKELSTDSYPIRTEKNVVDADATLILTAGRPTGGTVFTVECAKKHGRPHIVVDMEGREDRVIIHTIMAWLRASRPGTLNIAGPRESESPGIYKRSRRIFNNLFVEIEKNKEKYRL